MKVFEMNFDQVMENLTSMERDVIEAEIERRLELESDYSYRTGWDSGYEFGLESGYDTGWEAAQET